MGYASHSIIEKRIIASNDLIHSHDAEKETNDVWFILAKEITLRVPLVDSTLRIKCSWKRKETAGGRSHMLFRKNGSKVAGGLGVWVNDTDVYVEKSVDLEGWNSGDILQVEVYTTDIPRTTLTKNLRIYGIESDFENTY